MRGRLIRDGLRPGLWAERLTLPDLLHVGWALMVDEGANVATVTANVDRMLDVVMPDRETWGESPQAEAGAAAMMALMGKPAGGDSP